MSLVVNKAMKESVIASNGEHERQTQITEGCRQIANKVEAELRDGHEKRMNEAN